MPRKADRIAGIGGRLRRIRQDKDLTLEQVEAATKISSPYLSKVERDHSLPSPETFERIARSLEIPDDDLAHLLNDLLFERDRTELEKLGFHGQVAPLAAALNRLRPEAQDAAVECILREVPELVSFLKAPESGDQVGARP